MIFLTENFELKKHVKSFAVLEQVQRNLIRL